jgi:ribonuclease VapC
VILDTSALMAILLQEPEAEVFSRALEAAPIVRLSIVSYLETAIVVDRRGDPVRSAMLDEFLLEFNVRLEPVTVDQGRLAREAFRAFGKGRHPAGLNLGDCFSYALAKSMRERLLCKGNDFAQTDLGVLFED